MKTNRFGLNRHIPESIKQKIRQNSKFGCVFPNCRNAFYEYEHIIPEFKDAKEHDPEKICLVCCNHNPRKIGNKGNKNYSKEQIKKFYELVKNSEKAPDSINYDFFSGFNGDPIIVIGKSSFKRFSSIINIDGINVLSFENNFGDSPFSPQFTFSGVFKDSSGNILFTIIENEWISPTYHWDVVTKNGEISIWDINKNLAFKARKYPDENIIEIVELNMWFKPFHIFVSNGIFHIGRYSIDMKKGLYFGIDGSFKEGDCGVYLNSKNLSCTPFFAGTSIKGGEGILVQGNGIYLGKGAGVMILRSILLSNPE